MDQQPHTFNVHDHVPNLKPGLSETAKWLLGFLMALAAFFSPAVLELIRAPKEADWSRTRERIEELQSDVKLLKQAADAHNQLELEREKRRDYEYTNLKELIQRKK